MEESRGWIRRFREKDAVMLSSRSLPASLR
jgi:hypothetical protein